MQEINVKDLKPFVLIKSLPIKGFNKVGTVVMYDKITDICILPDGSPIKGIDVTNKEYFNSCAMQEVQTGTYVLYCTKLYTIDSFDCVRALYTLCPCDGGPIVKLGKHSFTPVKLYWFVNSHGEICKTYYGKDERADKWRTATDNVFLCIEDARAYVDNILGKIRVQ